MNWAIYYRIVYINKTQQLFEYPTVHYNVL